MYNHNWGGFLNISFRCSRVIQLKTLNPHSYDRTVQPQMTALDMALEVCLFHVSVGHKTGTRFHRQSLRIGQTKCVAGAI